MTVNVETALQHVGAHPVRSTCEYSRQTAGRKRSMTEAQDTTTEGNRKVI